MKTLNINAIIALALFSVIIIAPSCRKSEPITPKNTQQVASSELHPLWWIVSGVIVLIKTTEGQGTTTTTTYTDGSSTSTTTCNGLGSCSSGISYQGSDIGSLNNYRYVEDYSLNGEFVLNDKNELVMKVMNSDPSINRIFYAKRINFLTNDYIIDNSNFLRKLGLKKSFRIKAGQYDVKIAKGFKYINFGPAK